MNTWIVSITPWVDKNRKVDRPYLYEISAERAHTAVHRAMMEFHDEIGRYHSFEKWSADVEQTDEDDEDDWRRQ